MDKKIRNLKIAELVCIVVSIVCLVFVVGFSTVYSETGNETYRDIMLVICGILISSFPLATFFKDTEIELTKKLQDSEEDSH